MRSVQTGELTLPAEALEQLWSPMQLERLARTYWRFLSRCTLGLIRVDYGEAQRTVVLLRRPLRLLRFKAPEYAMDAERGIVRWRIEDGLLVQRRGHHGDGYLQIDVQRLPSPRRVALRASASRSRSRTSTRRSRTASADRSTASRSRASTCS